MRLPLPRLPRHGQIMAKKTEVTDLTGKLLIASPGMNDPRFAGSVIFVCAYGPDGAMGLVVNRPAPEIDLGKLLQQLDISAESPVDRIGVFYGGPVEPGRGFVLHGPDYHVADATLAINGAFSMTASLQILEALGAGDGPEQALLALGYSGWAPGQLEAEIADNGWLIADGTPALVFPPDTSAMWANALQTIGINPSSLSPIGGRA